MGGPAARRPKPTSPPPPLPAKPGDNITVRIRVLERRRQLLAAGTEEQLAIFFAGRQPVDARKVGEWRRRLCRGVAWRGGGGEGRRWASASTYNYEGYEQADRHHDACFRPLRCAQIVRDAYSLQQSTPAHMLLANDKLSPLAAVGPYQTVTGAGGAWDRWGGAALMTVAVRHAPWRTS